MKRFIIFSTATLFIFASCRNSGSVKSETQAEKKDDMPVFSSKEDLSPSITEVDPESLSLTQYFSVALNPIKNTQILALETAFDSSKEEEMKSLKFISVKACDALDHCKERNLFLPFDRLVLTEDMYHSPLKVTIKPCTDDFQSKNAEQYCGKEIEKSFEFETVDISSQKEKLSAALELEQIIDQQRKAGIDLSEAAKKFLSTEEKTNSNSEIENMAMILALNSTDIQKVLENGEYEYLDDLLEEEDDDALDQEDGALNLTDRKAGAEFQISSNMKILKFLYRPSSTDAVFDLKSAPLSDRYSNYADGNWVDFELLGETNLKSRESQNTRFVKIKNNLSQLMMHDHKIFYGLYSVNGRYEGLRTKPLKNYGNTTETRGTVAKYFMPNVSYPHRSFHLAIYDESLSSIIYCLGYNTKDYDYGYFSITESCSDNKFQKFRVHAVGQTDRAGAIFGVTVALLSSSAIIWVFSKNWVKQKIKQTNKVVEQKMSEARQKISQTIDFTAWRKNLSPSATDVELRQLRQAFAAAIPLAEATTPDGIFLEEIKSIIQEVDALDVKKAALKSILQQ